MNIEFMESIRRNMLLRVFGMPVLNGYRKLAYRAYQNSEDSQYIKSLKGKCQGERCFIIGNGPSLKPEDLEMLKGEKTFAINRIFYMYEHTKWRPTYYLAVDKNVLNKMKWEKQGVLEAEYIFLADRQLVKQYKEKNAHRILMSGKMPLKKSELVSSTVSEDVSCYFSRTQSVTVSAFELAVYMGFTQIYLLGVDHSFAIEFDKNGKKIINKDIMPHFKEDKDKSMQAAHIDALTQCYVTCRKYAETHGIQVVNVTRGGKLEVFERDTLENVLRNNEGEKRDDISNCSHL